MYLYSLFCMCACICQGPSDIAIFLDPGDKAPTPLPEEVMKEAQKAQKEIIELLAKVNMMNLTLSLSHPFMAKLTVYR